MTFDIFKKNKKVELTDNDSIKGALFGFFIGDALGVPVEFISRETLRKNKIKDMEEYGTHNQPKGTWSDDSSMVIATIDSLINEKRIDYYDIMNKFNDWYSNGKYTPFDKVFDIGNATATALNKYKNNSNEYKCGSTEIYSNGNGSLMRILPISIYLYYTDDPLFDVINNISGMTHAHIYSIFSCIIYSVFINEYLKNKNIQNSYIKMQSIIKDILNNKENENIENFDNLKNVFNRLIYNDISRYNENEIRSSGYVIDTLEACFWCLLTTNNYSDAVLKAVNLGDDTDTVAALTGGLAGLSYGYNSIPSKWINDLQKEEYLRNLVDDFNRLLEEKKTKTVYERTKGLENMNKLLNEETSNNKEKASKVSWKHEDFKTFDKVDCNIKITKEEMNIIIMGLIPKEMEDHWFMYCDENSINYYRSWTGIQIFKAYYKKIDDEYVIYMIEINNNKDEYKEDNVQNSIELFKNLLLAVCEER